MYMCVCMSVCVQYLMTFKITTMNTEWNAIV